MKNVLITGGAGFVGSSLARLLLRKGDYKVTIVDNLTTGSKSKLPPQNERLRFIKADVNVASEISSIMLSQSFDYVFHYAAVVGVERTLENPTKVLEDIDGIKNILDLSKNTGVKRVFFSSSSEVYGEPVEIPQHELTTPLNSRLPYAIVKNLGEAFFKSYHQEFGLDYTIFRFFNTYGPMQSDDFVVSLFLKKALNNENIPVIGDGSQTRTFCYVDDNVSTCAKIMEENLVVNDVINIGNNIETTILELAETVIRVTGSQSEIVHLPVRQDGDMKRRMPDNHKMMGIRQKPLLTLEEGLSKIVLAWSAQEKTL